MNDRSVRKISQDEINRVADSIAAKVAYNVIVENSRREPQVIEHYNSVLDYGVFARLWILIFLTVIMSLLLTGIINMIISRIY